MMEYMTTEQVAELLNVTSEATVKNWLQGGKFPGSYFENGEWKFHAETAYDVKVNLEETKMRNAAGDLSPPGGDASEEDVPLL